jgi:hypothetical protein
MYPRILIAVALLAVAAPAQWMKHPSAGIPRTKDGKPNLTAPAPRNAQGKPSIEGLWHRIRPAGTPPGPEFGNTVTYYLAPGSTISMQPWAEELFNKRRYQDLGGGRPSEHCQPHGILGGMLPDIPSKLVQTPGLTLLLYEQLTQFRQIFTDGRKHTPDPNPAWYGYSVGKWEGDAFVVETTGFTDKTWLDDSGYPNTEAMRSIEKFRRIDFGHLDLEVTIDDPKAYNKPWAVLIHAVLMPDTEMIEDVCENEKDAPHFVGK